MPMFKFNMQTAPSTPVEQASGVDEHSRSHHHGMSPSLSPSSIASSPDSCDSASKGSSNHRGWNQRRRRRGTPRNTEKRPYHSPTHVSPPHDKPMTKNDIYFALDCEMVGVGPEGLDSAVARVTICNWEEQAILDTFVKVPVKVTDYRTFVSGIVAKDLEGDDAMTLSEVRKLVKDTLHGKILIGHALENDLKALQFNHPWHDTRDSATYAPFMKKSMTDSKVLRPRKLKELVRDKLGIDIQTLGEAHDPIEDANAALRLYKMERMQWEKSIMKQVADARVKEGRDGEPSGRGSPRVYPRGNPHLINGHYAPPPNTASVPSAPTLPHMGQPHDMNYSHSLYYRSRSAPLPHTSGMAPHHRSRGYGHPPAAAYHYPQQHYLY